MQARLQNTEQIARDQRKARLQNQIAFMQLPSSQELIYLSFTQHLD